MSNPSLRGFRFGLQLQEADPAALVRSARMAEEAGFDVLLVGDHVDVGWAPLPILADLAARTDRIRLGTLVLNNDFRHPVLLAQEVTTLDHTSGGRFELGLGAGHNPHEYEAMGGAFDPPAIRKARLTESVEILRPLLDGRKVDFGGKHYTIRQAQVHAAAQKHLPILVAANGQRALSHAAQHADIIGLSGLGRTLPDGHHHEVRWAPSRLDQQVTVIRAAAGDRWEALELNVLVQRVHITGHRRKAAKDLAARIPGLTVGDALETPFLAIGTHAEIADQLIAARARWGISYLAVRDAASIAPVIERIR
jgi:probable F420-dependent oxidoreductase